MRAAYRLHEFIHSFHARSNCKHPLLASQLCDDVLHKMFEFVKRKLVEYDFSKYKDLGFSEQAWLQTVARIEKGDIIAGTTIKLDTVRLLNVAPFDHSLFGHSARDGERTT